MSKKAEYIALLGPLSGAIEEWADRKPRPGELDRLARRVEDRIRVVLGDRISADCRIEVRDCADPESEVKAMGELYALGHTPGRIGDDWADVWCVTLADLASRTNDPWGWLWEAVLRVLAESEHAGA